MLKPICKECKKEIIGLVVCVGKDTFHQECFDKTLLGKKVEKEFTKRFNQTI